MNYRKGFTIIESLVAITILVSVIIGATGAVQRGLASYQFSKDQIIAFYLAQEGFEQVRSIRDDNLINAESWLTGLADASSDPCWFGEACTVDPAASEDAIRCPSGACALLRQDAATGWYGYNAGWPETRFRRTISLSQINIDEITVTVAVSWNQGGAERTFRAKENLFNWH